MSRFCELLFDAVGRDPARYLTWLESLVQSRITPDVMRQSLEAAWRNTESLRSREPPAETDAARALRLQQERIAAVSSQVQP